MLKFALPTLTLVACSFDGSSRFLASDADPSVADANPPDADLLFDAMPADAEPAPSSGTVRFQDDLEGYTGTVDTFISSAEGDTSFGLSTALKWENDGIEMGLLRFDGIFGNVLGHVPPGATINSATLEIVVFDPSNGAGALMEAAVDWDENTTSNTFGPQPGIQGTDTTNAPIAVIPQGASSGETRISLVVTQSLQRWSNGDVNRGWALVSGNANDEQCRSSEYSVTADRPKLTVSYTVP